MPAAKYKFWEQESYDHTIVGQHGIVGLLRVKPSSILWKPKGSRKFLSVSLDDFRQWIKVSGHPVGK